MITCVHQLHFFLGVLVGPFSSPYSFVSSQFLLVFFWSNRAKSRFLLVLPGAAPPEFGDAQHHVLRLPRAYVGASAATQSLHERLLSGAAGPQFCEKSPSVVVLEMDFRTFKLGVLFFGWGG